MMLNHRLFFCVYALCMIFLTTHAMAQDHVETDPSLIQSVMPLKQSVEQQQQVLTDVPNQSLMPLKQSIEAQKEAQQQESVSAQTEEPQRKAETDSLGFRKAIDAFYEAAQDEDWESLKKSIDPVKPVLLMAITYGNEEHNYTPSDGTVVKMFPKSHKSTMLHVLFSINEAKPDCGSSTCSRSGMHMSGFVDHFVWNEKSQELLWVGTLYEAYMGQFEDDEVDRERFYELQTYGRELSDKFDKAVEKLYRRSAKKGSKKKSSL